MQDEHLKGRKKNDQIEISPREVLFKYVRYIPWIILSSAIMITLAYIKLRYSTPVYNVSGKLLVKKNSQYGGGSEKFDDIFRMQGMANTNLNDEIELIKSRSMAARVVKSLGLQTHLYNKGNIRVSRIHPSDFPLDVKFEGIKDSLKGFSCQITVVNANEFKINENLKSYYFGQRIELPECTLSMKLKHGIDFKYFSSNIFMISWSPLEAEANGISNGINVVQLNSFANVLRLDYKTENTKLGLDIINQFMTEYQKAGLEDKQETAVSTMAFIETQLDTVRRDLGIVEHNLLDYRQKNNIFSPVEQSELFFEELTTTRKELTDNEVKLKVIDYLRKYVTDNKNLFNMVPTTLGILEPSLIQQINEFNKLQVERQTALKTTPEANPYIQNFESPIKQLRDNIIENLDNIRQTYLLALKDLRNKRTEVDSEISSIPIKEKQLIDVKRQQSILQELYSYLLQKKLETSIASASTISNIKMLEKAEASGQPVSPQKRSIYTFAILIGLAVPIGILFLREYLNDKVKSRADIQKTTDAPIIGDVGHSESEKTLIVKKDSRNFIAEQFRIIRTNLQYIIHKIEKPVILITSSYSGEGKSFISTNVGAVMALAGKKTVILEFDIRKPKIVSGFNLNAANGITNFIVGSATLESLIIPVPNMENLYVVPCGPIPPNPAELLLDDKIEEIFTFMKAHFDTVIIDTAPVGLVSDAIILGKYADVSLYILRQNYTFKKQLELIDNLYTEKKIPSLSIILNDIKSTGASYGYGYGYGYGQTFGYGLGYFDGEKGKAKGVFQKIKNWVTWKA